MPVISESEVRQEVLPPSSGGVSPQALARYIREAEGRIKLSLGGTLPNNDTIRGIVRDIAGARALMKLAQNLEDYREANELASFAREALKDYIAQGGESEGGFSEGVNENAVANIDEDPLWRIEDFDARRRVLVPQHHDGTDFWDVWG